MFTKNVYFILAICLCFVTAKAQNLSKQTKTDTTTPAPAGHIKTRIVGGGQMSSAKDVVENIGKSKDHTTFTNSIKVAGLSETLKSRGPLTVFAPTNDAFKKLAPGLLDTLLKPAHNLDLTRLLAYHVISGRLTSKSIAKQIAENKGEATFTTLAGSKLRAKINGDRNIVLIDENGNEAVISQFDIEQNNGIIDVVNAILVPKSK